MTLLEYLAKGRRKPFARLIKGLQEPLFWLMGLLFVACLAVVFYFHDTAKPDTVDLEIAKVALQVGIVSVAGGLLSLLVSNREQQVEDAQAKRDEDAKEARYRQELLEATLNRVTSSYYAIKRARREMRALGLDSSDGPPQVDIKQWDECMKRVNDAQLEFEAIIIDVDKNPETYGSGGEFKARLRAMEKYLGKLVTEYEDDRPRWGPEVSAIPLSELDKLSDFLTKAKNKSRFKVIFSDAHKLARGAIRKDLYDLTSKTSD